MDDVYTVRQLIRALQDFPQDLPVYDDCREGICAVHIIKDENCPWMPDDYVMLKTTVSELYHGMEESEL